MVAGAVEPARSAVDFDRDPPRSPVAVSAARPQVLALDLVVREHEIDWRLSRVRAVAPLLMVEQRVRPLGRVAAVVAPGGARELIAEAERVISAQEHSRASAEVACAVALLDSQRPRAPAWRTRGGPRRSVVDRHGAPHPGRDISCHEGEHDMGDANEALLRWFRQGGWTQLELARAVGRLGRARGYNVAPDSSRVRRWLEGERPRHPVPELLAALFADRTGRPCTPADLGLATPSPTRDQVSWDHRALVATLQDFTRSDLMIKRRDVLGATAALATGAVLEGRLTGWLDADDTAPTPALGPGRIGTAEIAEIEAATRTFWAWDAKRGGGLYREAVVGQLKAMTDLLDHTYPDAISRRLFRSTADLARLAGWMSHDVGLQATAQQYFTLALHCAKRARDTGLGVEVLSRMARQMVHVGKPREALSLVALARRGSGSRLGPMPAAMLATCESWAHATLGDIRAVDRAVGAAEADFARADPAEAPAWLSYFDRAGLEGMAALSYRTVAEHRPGVEKRAEPHLAEALRLRRDSYQRSNLFDVISLVGVRVLQGEHAEANRLAADLLSPAGRISSTRTFDRIEVVRDRAVADSARSKDARSLADTLAAVIAA